MYQTPKHHHVCRDNIIDNTPLFLVNYLALTRVESKFCMDKLWNEVCDPAVPVIMLGEGALFYDILCNHLLLL